LPLLVWRLDRLGCSLPGLLKIIGELERESQLALRNVVSKFSGKGQLLKSDTLF
jgi:hypothetical protein